MAGEEKLDILTFAEAQRRLREMSSADYVRLVKIAKAYVVGTEWTPRDLVHQALLALLEDRRVWRLDLPLVVYVVGIMRSIASAFRKKHRTNHPSGEPVDRATHFSRLHESEADGSDPGYWVLEEEAARDRLQSLLEYFADDPQVKILIDGLMRGESPAWIRNFIGVDEKAFATIRRRLRRGYEELKRLSP